VSSQSEKVPVGGAPELPLSYLLISYISDGGCSVGLGSFVFVCGFFVFVFVLVGLGFELRASSLPSRCFIT
jgi:hypothetical protein